MSRHLIASNNKMQNAMPFICSIPLIVPDQTNIGLVFGIWKGWPLLLAVVEGSLDPNSSSAFNNAGSVIVDVATGRLQDIVRFSIVFSTI